MTSCEPSICIMPLLAFYLSGTHIPWGYRRMPWASLVEQADRSLAKSHAKPGSKADLHLPLDGWTRHALVSRNSWGTRCDAESDHDGYAISGLGQGPRCNRERVVSWAVVDRYLPQRARAQLPVRLPASSDLFVPRSWRWAIAKGSRCRFAEREPVDRRRLGVPFSDRGRSRKALPISRRVNPRCFAVGKWNHCAVTKVKTREATGLFRDPLRIRPSGRKKEHRRTCRKSMKTTGLSQSTNFGTVAKQCNPCWICILNRVMFQ
jgi:hypothetical protein